MPSSVPAPACSSAAAHATWPRTAAIARGEMWSPGAKGGPRVTPSLTDAPAASKAASAPPWPPDTAAATGVALPPSLARRPPRAAPSWATAAMAAFCTWCADDKSSADASLRLLLCALADAAASRAAFRMARNRATSPEAAARNVGLSVGAVLQKCTADSRTAAALDNPTTATLGPPRT